MDKRLLSPLPMWLIIAAGAAGLLASLPLIMLFTLGWPGTAILAVTFINWIVLLPLATIHNKFVIRSAAGVEGIITSGPYRYVRHPIYSADIIFAWGIALAFPYLPVLLAAVWLSAVMVAWASMEEDALAERFAKEYQAYRQRTPMLIPDYKAAVRSLMRAGRG